MLNSHSFTKIDRFGVHKTTYEVEPKPNPRFSGKTVLEEWFEYDPTMRQILDGNIKTRTNVFFDGDTIEFITENFYKSTIASVVSELQRTKDDFLEKFKKFRMATCLWPQLGEFYYVREHPGLNSFITQPHKIVPFNNTTYHVHITLPTAISRGVVVNKKEFVEHHTKCISYIQWIEPFLICVLGSPDIMNGVAEIGTSEINNSKFAGGSMRCALSRYIGVGTFNTETMESGKILTRGIEELRPSDKNVTWWRDRVVADLGYRFPETEIGLDFNFNKHYQSGFEFRMLDAFPIEHLEAVLYILTMCCECAIGMSTKLPRACNDNDWNSLVYKSLRYGYLAKMTLVEIQQMNQLLGFDVNISPSGEVANFTMSAVIDPTCRVNGRREVKLCDGGEMLMVDYFREYVIQKHTSLCNSWQSTNVMKYLVCSKSVDNMKEKLDVLFEQNFNCLQQKQHAEFLLPL
jgi:hypothetical protein